MKKCVCAKTTLYQNVPKLYRAGSNATRGTAVTLHPEPLETKSHCHAAAMMSQRHRSAARPAHLAQHSSAYTLDFGATGAAATATAATAAVAGDDGGSGGAGTDASPSFRVFPLSAAVPGAPPAALGLAARFVESCSWVSWPSLESTLLAKFIGPCIDTLSLPMLRTGGAADSTHHSAAREMNTRTTIKAFRSDLAGVGQSVQAGALTSVPGIARAARWSASPRVPPRWSSSNAQ